MVVGRHGGPRRSKLRVKREEGAGPKLALSLISWGQTFADRGPPEFWGLLLRQLIAFSPHFDTQIRITSELRSLHLRRTENVDRLFAKGR